MRPFTCCMTMILLGHVDVQCSTLNEVCVLEDEGTLFAAFGLIDSLTLERLAIEDCFLDVESFVAETVSTDGKGLTAANMDSSLFDQRRAEDIVTTTGSDLIETEGRENVPCRHLTYVLVAAETCRLIGVQLVLNLVYNLGCLAGLTHEGIKVGDVVAGFVAVSILTDKTCDVRLRIFVELAVSQEEAVKTLHGYLASAEHLHETFYIVGNEPEVLPGVTLGEGTCLVVGVETLEALESAVRVLTTHKSYALVIECGIAV